MSMRLSSAVAAHTNSVCPVSVTILPENFRTLIALRAATLTTWHVGAVRAM